MNFLISVYETPEDAGRAINALDLVASKDSFTLVLQGRFECLSGAQYSTGQHHGFKVIDQANGRWVAQRGEETIIVDKLSNPDMRIHLMYELRTYEKSVYRASE